LNFYFTFLFYLIIRFYIYLLYLHIYLFVVFTIDNRNKETKKEKRQKGYERDSKKYLNRRGDYDYKCIMRRVGWICTWIEKEDIWKELKKIKESITKIKIKRII